MKNKSEVLSTNTPMKSTPQAVVIGCSHENPNCNHEIHPSKEDFYTIDIDAAANPDLSIDITKNEFPESLKNNFKLAILEFLPYHAYNHDELMTRVTGYSGQNGLDNIRKMTDENGLIMIIGNSRDFGFRSSLARLNYFEVAEVKEVGSPKEAGSYILLIPNNQKLSVDKVKQQIDALPIACKKSIEKATTRKMGESLKWNPLEPTEFCKLNYKLSDENKGFITALSTYVSARMFQEEYKTSIDFFIFKINLGYSCNEKINAANALINVLLNNQPLDSLTPHIDALSNGLLGHTVDNYLKGRSIQDLIYTNQPKSMKALYNNEQSINAKKITQTLKEDLKAIIKDESSQEEMNSRVKNNMSSI